VDWNAFWGILGPVALMAFILACGAFIYLVVRSIVTEERVAKLEKEGYVLCTFIPLNGMPYSKYLKPDSGGLVHEGGKEYLVISGIKPIYREYPAQEVKHGLN
jgi:hypothetical protein